MKTVVIGGSAGLGREVAAEIARRRGDVLIVSTDERDGAAVAADLRLRHGVRAVASSVDIAHISISDFRMMVDRELGAPDALFIIAGLSEKEDEGVLRDDQLNRLIGVNLVAPMRLINSYVPEMIERGGHIVVAGSVAAFRPRPRNLVYGSCKSAIEFYCEALRHALHATPCSIAVYRLGYLKTSMTFGQKLLFPVADPADIAKDMVRRLGRRGIFTRPRWWGLIGLILRMAPDFIIQRLRV